MSPHELLMVTQCFPPTHGGIETLMAHLARTLYDAGNPITVVAKPPKGSSTEFDQGEPYPIRRITPWVGLLRAPLILRAVRAQLAAHPRANGVITDSWKAASVIAPLVKQRGLRLTILAHGNEMTHKGKPSRMRRMTRAFSAADHIVANSDFTASLLAEIDHTAGKVQVIPPGIDPSRFDLQADMVAFRERWNLQGRKVILTLARLEPRKGHDQVLAALATGEGLQDVVYLVAGEGADRARLERLAAEYRVADRVRFVGSVSAAEKSTLYRLCDLFVMPNRPDTCGNFSVEGFGIVFLEAALFGKPTIGGDSGGVPDAIVSGQTGELIQPLDLDGLIASLTRLLGDDALSRQMGLAGRERALKQFTWQQIGVRYQQMWDSQPC